MLFLFFNPPSAQKSQAHISYLSSLVVFTSVSRENFIQPFEMSRQNVCFKCFWSDWSERHKKEKLDLSSHHSEGSCWSLVRAQVGFTLCFHTSEQKQRPLVFFPSQVLRGSMWEYVGLFFLFFLLTKKELIYVYLGQKINILSENQIIKKVFTIQTELFNLYKDCFFYLLWGTLQDNHHLICVPTPPPFFCLWSIQEKCPSCQIYAR